MFWRKSLISRFFKGIDVKKKKTKAKTKKSSRYSLLDCPVDQPLSGLLVRSPVTHSLQALCLVILSSFVPVL